jgi:type II secretory pathway pseudopilin PulG
VLRVSVLLRKRKALRAARRRGITLIEAALVLSLTGVLAAAFVPTFLKQVHTSKLAEATQLLASLERHAALYYEHEHVVGGVVRHGCLPASAGPFPLEPSLDPVSVDFHTDPLGEATWRALGRNAPALLRYSYEVSVPEPGCSQRQTRPTITFRAHGDLDGDGNHSLLERTSVGEAGDEVEARGSSARERRHDRLVPQGPLRILARAE